VYRLNYEYPPTPGCLKLGPALGEIMSTHKGIYTSMGSSLITEKVMYNSILIIENTPTRNLFNDTFNI
jgi:hypothetical protein